MQRITKHNMLLSGACEPLTTVELQRGYIYSVITVFMPDVPKRFHCISVMVNNHLLLAFGLFEDVDGGSPVSKTLDKTVCMRKLFLF